MFVLSELGLPGKCSQFPINPKITFDNVLRDESISQDLFKVRPSTFGKFDN